MHALRWLAVIALGVSGRAWATCDVRGAPQTLTYTGPGNITVPRDVPDGTVVYRETKVLSEITFDCFGSTNLYGLKVPPKRGSPPPAGTFDFPTGTPGLSFRMMIRTGAYMPPPFALEPGQYKLVGNITLEIVKSAAFEPSGLIQAGDVGTVIAWTADLVTLKLSRPVGFIAGSCESPDVNVFMGDDYVSSDFKGPGTRTRPVSFTLKLNNCPPRINKINYRLLPVTEVIDPNQGLVRLNEGSGAVGIGLQIRDGNDVPLALNTPHTFTGYTGQGGSFQIPLMANYYRLTNEPRYKAGAANTEITFVMSYL